MDLVARWLKAHCYETKYRPVPIEEHLVYGNEIYSTASTRSLIRTVAHLTQKGTEPSRTQTMPLRHILPSTHKEFTDSVLNAVVSLASETALAGHGALVFASSRSMCESDARWISKVMPASHELPPSVLDQRLELLGSLRSLGTGMDPVLEETVLHGVAFHRTSRIII